MSRCRCIFMDFQTTAISSFESWSREIDRDLNRSTIKLREISWDCVSLRTSGCLGCRLDASTWRIYVKSIYQLGKIGTGTSSHAKTSAKKLQKFKSKKFFKNCHVWSWILKFLIFLQKNLKFLKLNFLKKINKNYEFNLFFNFLRKWMTTHGTKFKY